MGSRGSRYLSQIEKERKKDFREVLKTALENGIFQVEKLDVADATIIQAGYGKELEELRNNGKGTYELFRKSVDKLGFTLGEIPDEMELTGPQELLDKLNEDIQNGNIPVTVPEGLTVGAAYAEAQNKAYDAYQKFKDKWEVKYSSDDDDLPF